MVNYERAVDWHLIYDGKLHNAGRIHKQCSYGSCCCDRCAALATVEVTTNLAAAAVTAAVVIVD